MTGSESGTGMVAQHLTCALERRTGLQEAIKLVMCENSPGAPDPFLKSRRLKASVSGTAPLLQNTAWPHCDTPAVQLGRSPMQGWLQARSHAA